MSDGLEFQTSVRALVDFAHRTGDLAGETGFRSSDRAVEGTRGHRRIQESRGEDYRAEIPVERAFEREGVRLVITGRVDGLVETADPPLVEEIKTVTRGWPGHPDPLHLAQLRAYAALLAADSGWKSVRHRLVYLDLDTDLQTVFEDVETDESLAGFLDETLHEWFSWLVPRARWLALRKGSLEHLPFPFGAFRAGQRDLARRVYRAIRGREVIFVEAPTGLGKSLATLYPAVRALPLLADAQIFYVTAKTPGRLAAAQALDGLRSAGARLRSLVLTAKKTICFGTSEAGCDPRICPYALGYFDRIKPAVRRLLETERLDRTAVEEVAREHRVCPFELSLDVSRWTDVVVGDFNHVFDPSSRLQRHFGEGPARHVVLVDEAHNLVDRSREMHSATLSASQLVPGKTGRVRGGARARRALEEAAAAITGTLSAARSSPSLLPSRPHHDAGVALADPPKDLLVALRRSCRQVEEFLLAQPPGFDASPWMEAWFGLAAFLRAAEGFDAACRFLALPGEEAVKIFCADPSARLREALRGLRSAVFFSATLSPAAYFRDLLGGDDSTACFAYDSPFRPEQMTLSVTGHDVTFRGRAATLPAVAAEVVRHLGAHPGNHLVFCPSLSYLRDLEPLLAEALPAGDLLVQHSTMDDAERAVFLDRFSASSRVVGLAVLGGIFSEGIDLPGSRLIGVTVIGVGLPRLCLERDVLQAHFDSTRGSGYDFAYRYPGMQRVLQAVGRLIRTETDRGAALLIDRRYRESRYRALFPAWWEPAWRRTGAE